MFIALLVVAAWLLTAALVALVVGKGIAHADRREGTAVPRRQQLGLEPHPWHPVLVPDLVPQQRSSDWPDWDELDVLGSSRPS